MKITIKQKEKAKRLHDQGETWKNIAKKTGIKISSLTSVLKLKKGIALVSEKKALKFVDLVDNKKISKIKAAKIAGIKPGSTTHIYKKYRNKTCTKNKKYGTEKQIERLLLFNKITEKFTDKHKPLNCLLLAGSTLYDDWDNSLEKMIISEYPNTRLFIPECDKKVYKKQLCFIKKHKLENNIALFSGKVKDFILNLNNSPFTTNLVFDFVFLDYYSTFNKEVLFDVTEVASRYCKDSILSVGVSVQMRGKKDYLLRKNKKSCEETVYRDTLLQCSDANVISIYGYANKDINRSSVYMKCYIANSVTGHIHSSNKKTRTSYAC